MDGDDQAVSWERNNRKDGLIKESGGLIKRDRLKLKTASLIEYSNVLHFFMDKN